MKAAPIFKLALGIAIPVACFFSAYSLAGKQESADSPPQSEPDHPGSRQGGRAAATDRE